MVKLVKPLRYAAWGLAGLSLAWFLIALLWLKSPIGVHFDSDGNFDVFDSKLYGFYPHLINLLCIGITALADFLTGKINPGLKVTPQGETAARTAIWLSIGFGRFGVVLMFCYWNALVIFQHALTPEVPQTIMLLLMLGGIATAAALIVIRIRFRRKGNA